MASFTCDKDDMIVFGVSPLQYYVDISNPRLSKSSVFNCSKPTRVVYNGKTTIVWFGNEKIVVKCGEFDVFDEANGVAHAMMKKMFGSRNQFNKFIRDIELFSWESCEGLEHAVAKGIASKVFGGREKFFEFVNSGTHQPTKEELLEKKTKKQKKKTDDEFPF